MEHLFVFCGSCSQNKNVFYFVGHGREPGGSAAKPMDLSFTQEQEALRGLVREILDAQATADRLREAEAGPDWIDRGLWAELGRANVLGIGVPESHGGVGGGLIEACILLEEIGRAVAPVPYLHPIATLALARYGVDAAFFERICTGEAIQTVAVSGSVEAPQGMLSGEMRFVPFAHLAEGVLVASDAGVYVPDPAATTLQRQTATNGEPQATLTFKQTPAMKLAGADDARWLRHAATAALCAIQAGVCERALRMTAAYLSEREQFDRPLATFQAVQQRAADAYIDVQAIRWTMWQAVTRLENGDDATEDVAIAKFWAAEAGQRVVSAAQHLHGGIGVDVDYPLHRYTTWAKQMELSLGGAGEQLARLGDAMADRA